MIAKGNAHNNGSKLAAYLMNGGKHGERAELAELRGFGTTLDIKDAFRDVHIMAEGTKAKQPLFHVQVRLPDGEKLTREQWHKTANRIERMLGLTDQPRAIVFHFDKQTGEEHMHVAWSRIDAETMKAIPIPFHKERLKKLSRELELHFGLQQVTSQRDSEIKFAPTKAEDEQARRLGVNIHDIRETIRACYNRSDCGQSFKQALADEGIILAQGDRRDYLVIDHAGGLHALGKRLLDVPAGQVRPRLADLDRTELPTIEQAREVLLSRELAAVQEQIKAEREYAKRDPVREETAWLDAVAAAAIEKEKAERKLAAEREPQPERQPPVKPEKGIPAEIWTARQQSDNARAFDQALQDRDIVLARATKEDVQRQRELYKVVQQYGNRVTTFQEGEVVALTKRGEIYRLTERTTGQTWKEGQQFTAGLKLESVGHTREILHRAWEAERLAAVERAKKARELEQIAKAATKRGPERPGMVAQQMWAVRRLADHAEQQRREQQRRDEQERRASKATGEVDPQRYLTDPDYRRQVRTERAYQTPEERKTEKENNLRALLEQQDRQR